MVGCRNEGAVAANGIVINNRIAGIIIPQTNRPIAAEANSKAIDAYLLFFGPELNNRPSCIDGWDECNDDDIADEAEGDEGNNDVAADADDTDVSGVDGNGEG